MTSGIYSVFKGDLFRKSISLISDTINVALYDNVHDFTATDTKYTTSNELAAAGNYTQGGSALAGKSVTEGITTKFDATDLAWTTATFTAYHAVIYNISNGSSLIASIDFGGAKTVSAGTFTLQWSGDGIITLA